MRGTVPMLSTTVSQPLTPGTLARPVVSMVLTEPPPPEPSTSRIKGRRISLAICSHMRCLPLMVASAEPPRTEVVAAHHHGPAIDPGAAEDEVGGREALELVGLIVGGDAGNLADLVEAARVRELADALADGEAAAVALPLHSLGAAQLLRESLAAPELLQLRLPALRASARIGHGAG